MSDQLSELRFKSRSYGKISEQVLQLYMQTFLTPDIEIQVWSPSESYPKNLIKVADQMGFDLKMTIPERLNDTDTWVSYVHSIVFKDVAV